MDEFKGKTAIITGATSGMGKDIAASLFKLETNLILSGRNETSGKNQSDAYHPSAVFIGGDIKNTWVNELLVSSALEHFGRLDMAVLAAGQLGIGRLDSLSISDWEETITTNLSAVFYLLKYAIPAMRLSGGGRIVIIGSIAAQHTFPNHPAYTASKGALPPLVHQIARDFGPDIRINLVSPAQVMTPLLMESVKAFDNPNEILENTAQKLPMQRLGEPMDITQTVMHLLSDQASWITGSNFIVDGGFLST